MLVEVVIQNRVITLGAPLSKIVDRFLQIIGRGKAAKDQRAKPELSSPIARRAFLHAGLTGAVFTASTTRSKSDSATRLQSPNLRNLAGAGVPLGDFEADTTIFCGAGQRVTDLATALEIVHDRHIRPNAIVTIQVADGTYRVDRPQAVHHPAKHNLRILGNVQNPQKVRFYVSRFLKGSSRQYNGHWYQARSFLEMRGQGQLGFVDGFHVVGAGWTTAGDWSGTARGAPDGRGTWGLFSPDGTGWIAGSKMIIERVYYPVSMEGAGTFELKPGGRYLDGGDACILGYGGAYGLCRGVFVSGAKDVEFGLGCNAIAEAGSFLRMNEASSRYAFNAHFQGNGGEIWAHETLCEAGGIAFDAINGGGVQGKGSVSRSCFGTARASGTGSRVGIEGALSLDPANFHFLADEGRLYFGRWKVRDRVGLQGEPRLLPTRAGETANGFPLARDVLVQNQGFADLGSRSDLLTRFIGAETVLEQSVFSDGRTNILRTPRRATGTNGAVLLP